MEAHPAMKLPLDMKKERHQIIFKKLTDAKQLMDEAAWLYHQPLTKEEIKQVATERKAALEDRVAKRAMWQEKIREEGERNRAAHAELMQRVATVVWEHVEDGPLTMRELEAVMVEDGTWTGAAPDLLIEDPRFSVFRDDAGQVYVMRHADTTTQDAA